MSRRALKIAVTAVCHHPGGWYDHGPAITGSHVVVSIHGVILDGRQVIKRDRRAKVNREAGHPWLALTERGTWQPYTAFDVMVVES